MSIVIKGYTLNQRQLDAIVPVMNDLMQDKVSKRGFEKACIKALEEAGCPLGYDTALPGADVPVEARARRWIVDGQVGMSSKAIWSHMMDVPCREMSDPRDPDDLNRCLLLLDLIPEWASRMGEMAQYGASWAGLSARWGEIAGTFIAEVGLNWSHGKRAPQTYALMQAARGAVERKQETEASEGGAA